MYSGSLSGHLIDLVIWIEHAIRGATLSSASWLRLRLVTMYTARPLMNALHKVSPGQHLIRSLLASSKLTENDGGFLTPLHSLWIRCKYFLTQRLIGAFESSLGLRAVGSCQDLAYSPLCCEIGKYVYCNWPGLLWAPNRSPANPGDSWWYTHVVCPRT